MSEPEEEKGANAEGGKHGAAGSGAPSSGAPSSGAPSSGPGRSSGKPEPAHSTRGTTPDGVFGDATVPYGGTFTPFAAKRSESEPPDDALKKGAASGADQDPSKGAGSPPEEAVGSREGRDTKPIDALSDSTEVTDSGAPAEDATDAEADEGSADSAQQIRVRYYGETNVGLIREHNEDNFLVADFGSGQRGLESVDDSFRVATASASTKGTLLAVCDGMGGAAAGEVASQMAVDTLFEFFSSLSKPRDRDHFARRIVASIEEAGGRIFSSAKADRSQRGMGTTATVAGLMDKVLFVGQVGDSRAYVLRGDTLVQITKDQSLVNQLIEAGQLTEDEAEAFEHSNIILQALGTTEDVTVDLTFLELRRGDRLMMCSDGLSGLVHHDMIKDVLAEGTELPEICARLIEMANTGGGHDNITVVCADFDGEGLAEPKEDEVPIYQQYPLPVSASDDAGGSLRPKRRMASGAAGAPPVVGSDEPVGPLPRNKGPGKAAGVLVGVALSGAVLIVIAMGLFWFFNSSTTGRTGGGTLGAGAGTRSQGVDPLTTKILSGPALVRVTVTGIQGDLWVDEKRYQLAPGTRAQNIEVEPGIHTFESRTADGHAVAQEVRQINLGEPVVVQLVPLDDDPANTHEGDASEAPVNPRSSSEQQSADAPSQGREAQAPEVRRTQTGRRQPVAEQDPSRTPRMSQAETTTGVRATMTEDATGAGAQGPRQTNSAATEMSRPPSRATSMSTTSMAPLSTPMERVGGEALPDNPFD